MKKETYKLMERLIGLLEKDKFPFIEVTENEYSGVSISIKIFKEEKKK